MCLNYLTGWLTLSLFLPIIQGQMFEGDSCTMKSTSGVCKLASQCPELETAVRAGRFSTRDIVNCGYTTREEIICCPGGDSVTTENRSDDRFIFERNFPATSNTFSSTTTTTTTVATSTDFWEHLLTTTPSTMATTTTSKPDFWLHLLNTTTSTTTPIPLMIHGKELDPDSDYIDLSALLSQNGRRQKNSAENPTQEKPQADNDVSLPKQMPDSINDRTFGWQTPTLSRPSPPVNWNAQRPRQWNTGSRNNFQTNDGMPFIDDWRNRRGGRVMWGNEQPNAPFSNRRPFSPPNQSNIGWSRQQEATIARPDVNWNLPQSRIFPNQGNQFSNSEMNTWNRPTQRSWPSNNENNNLNGGTFQEWQNGNNFPTGNNFVENFGPINSGFQSQNFAERPTSNRWPNPSIEALPNRHIWPENNVQYGSNNLENNMRNPISMVNDNLINAGLEIIKAEANEVERDNGNNKTQNYVESSEEESNTPRTPISDIYKPFQFRPQPNDYDDNPTERTRPFQGGSNDFRFPGAVQNRPTSNIDQSKKRNGDVTALDRSTTNTSNITTRTNDRPAVVACREIDAGLDPGLSYHILGGTPVELREFPHMAAIGYSSIGDDDGPFEYRCGGTLIAKKFVLTAAHCVNNIDSQPKVVLLGLVDINNPEQRQNADELRIKQVHIYNDYSNSRTYHDVAILELEREVVYTEFIYPTCLYTSLDDPPAKAPVYVSGWGQINTGSRQKSNILLKAKLEIVPVSKCNASYVEMGLTRRINVGVIDSQMCANDPGFTKDACQGDSGGPLILVEDEAFRKYRIVGIISAGFSCGSATPGLYTRVGSYLDYIESIVWPNST